MVRGYRPLTPRAERRALCAPFCSCKARSLGIAPIVRYLCETLDLQDPLFGRVVKGCRPFTPCNFTS